MSTPAIRTTPSLGRSSVPITCSSVDLPGARRAHHGDELALADREVDAAQRQDGPRVLLHDPRELEDRLAHCEGRRRARPRGRRASARRSRRRTGPASRRRGAWRPAALTSTAYPPPRRATRAVTGTARTCAATASSGRRRRAPGRASAGAGRSSAISTSIVALGVDDLELAAPCRRVGAGRSLGDLADADDPARDGRAVRQARRSRAARRRRASGRWRRAATVTCCAVEVVVSTGEPAETVEPTVAVCWPMRRGPGRKTTSPSETAPVCGQAERLLPALDRRGRRRVEVVVDDDRLARVVAERDEIPLELPHVGPVGDAGRQRAPHGNGAVHQHDGALLTRKRTPPRRTVLPSGASQVTVPEPARARRPGPRPAGEPLRGRSASASRRSRASRSRSASPRGRAGVTTASVVAPAPRRGRARAGAAGGEPDRPRRRRRRPRRRARADHDAPTRPPRAGAPSTTSAHGPGSSAGRPEAARASARRRRDPGREDRSGRSGTPSAPSGRSG